MPRNPIGTHVQDLARDETPTWTPKQKQGLFRALDSMDTELSGFEAQIAALSSSGNFVFPGVVVYGKIVELTTTPFNIPEPPELGIYVYSLKNAIGTVVVNWPTSFRDIGLYQPSQSINTVSSAIFVKESSDLTYPITPMGKGILL